MLTIAGAAAADIPKGASLCGGSSSLLPPNLPRSALCLDYVAAAERR